MAASGPTLRPGLAGSRWLVVGATSGIGRAFATRAAEGGARLALVGRRQEPLSAVAGSCDGSAIVADVRAPADCERMVAEAVAALGGLDGLVYSAGITPLAWLRDADAEHWRAVFETNALGAAWVSRAALPHLAGGLAAYVSSDCVGRPRPGLAAYSASKAALDEVIRALRTEQPDTRFLRVVVGPTIGTDIARDYEPARVGELMRLWVAHGFMTRLQMRAEELGAVLAEVLASARSHPEVAIEDLRLEPPGPLVSTPD